jgi:hypothetical protein
MKGLLHTPYFLLLKDAPHPALRLLPETETLDHASVAFHVFLLHIIKKPAPLAHKLQKSPPGMVILLVGFEVFRKIVDPAAEEGNLNLRRSRIFLMQLIIAYDSTPFTCI